MIYFIQDTETLAIKIGFTSDPTARIAALQTGNSSCLKILMVTPGERSDEADLHQRFAASRIAGEWFRPSTDLIQMLIGHALIKGFASGRGDVDFADYVWARITSERLDERIRVRS